VSALGKAKRIVTDAFTPSGRLSLMSRVADRISARVPPSLHQHHVLAADILGATQVLHEPTERPRGASLRIGWIVTPPVAGSGGHTTAFRMVTELERAGHRCELVLYDIFGGSNSEREAVIRQGWPQLKAGVRSIESGLDGFDAVVATGWQTAYALATRSAGLDLHRFYFMQDFEPFFYPHGYEYSLAEATYSLDMNRIALGEMVASRVRQAGSGCSVVPFGCDTDTYHLTGESERSGVVFYSRAGTTRRGFLLAAMGLEEFHRRRPQVPIKVFGPLEKAVLSFPISWQGLLTPAQLNDLYNTSVAGLGMSFTNTSLVVGEMLSSGCVPIVNDSVDGRMDMPSPYVRWVDANPRAVADALEAVVDKPPTDVERIAASTNVNWAVTQREFVAELTSVVTGDAGERDSDRAS
jgi:beta-1,2-rhamnosyltransferase WsaF-like protein